MSYKVFFSSDAEIRDLRTEVLKLAKAGINFHITGETGVGKSFLVNHIHNKLIVENYLSASAPLVKIDCGNIVESLFETELFGSRKGAYSDAIDKKGKLELANGGILFLDEIGNLPLSIQIKCLTAFEEKCISPVGSNQKIEVNFILITATNKDMKKEKNQNKFREDLYYRFCGNEYTIPPLRQKPKLLREFLDYFIGFYLEQYNSSFTISSEHLEVLLNYTWPGNIRELSRTIRTLIVLEESVSRLRDKLNRNDNNIQLKPKKNATFKERINYYEKSLIINNLRNTQGRISKAAKMLVIPRATLINKIKKLEINAKAFKK